MAPPAISATRLGIAYNLDLAEPRTLKSALPELARLRPLRRRRRDFWALKDVNFTSSVGDILGVIGRNGSGKSTLLLAIAGILEPDEGRVNTFGYRSTLLTLGAGFENDLTGRENVYLNAAFLGIPQKLIARKMDQIIAFSELGAFIDAPLRKYSSGMRARLGFAVAANIPSDILLLDEIFSVGDAGFQKESEARLKHLMREAKSIVVATHDMAFVRNMCSTALWLDKGTVAAHGDPEEVADAYAEFLSTAEEAPVRPVPAAVAADGDV